MRKLGVIIFGASVYDHHRELDNPRFATSSEEFQNICLDKTIIPDYTTTVLNLYNEALFPSETNTKIMDFVSQDFDSVIIYYCGHGDAARRKDEYFVFLRTSRRDRRSATLLNLPSLVLDVERISVNKKIFFVLDACYSGDVINQMKEFMDAGAAASMFENPFEELSQSGIAIFAATRGSDVALAKQEDPLTLFTGALVSCVRKGLAYRSEQPTLSWLDVRDYIVRTTYERLGADAPIPKIVSLDDKYGDITRIPFFRNLAYIPPVRSNRKRKPISEEEAEYSFWTRIPDSAGIEVFDDFLNKFPSGIYNLVALALIKERVENKTSRDLRQFLRDYPRSRGAAFARARLTALDWQQIKDSTDIAALEQFIAAHPDSALVEDAKARIDAIRKAIADEHAWWERIKTTTDASELDRFLTAHPDGPFSEAARVRLAELPAPPDPAAPTPSTSQHDAIAAPPDETNRASTTKDDKPPIQDDGAKTRARPFVALVAGILSISALAFVVAGLVHLGVRNAAGDRYRAELAAAGTDVTALTAFLTRCEASTNCPVLSEARAQLQRAQAERDRRAEAEQAKFRSDLRDAGNDIGKLMDLIARCQAAPNCPVLADARAQLQRAQSERARQLQRAEAEQAKFRSDLRDAGNDTGKLVDLVARCQASANCPVLAEAQQRLQAERTRQAEITQFQNELQAAGNDSARLTTLIARCLASANCLVFAEAQQRLQALANAFDRYPSWDLDLGPNQLLQPPIKPSNSINACESSCQANGACKGYSFDKWNSICYLKSGFVTFSADPRSDSGVRKIIQAPYASAMPKRFCTYGNSTIEGPTIRTIPNSADWEACKDSCAGEQNCVAYTLSPNNSCRLLSNTTDRFTGRAGFYSGIKSQNPDCQR